MASKNKGCSRRDFLTTAGATGVGAVLTQHLLRKDTSAETAAKTSKNKTVPTRPFGRTGKNVSMLSLGGMFDIPTNQIVLKLALQFGREKVGTLAAGEFFGEMSLLTGARRRATVRTVDEVRLLEISKAAIEPIIVAHPPVAEGLSAALERRLNQIMTAQQIRVEAAEAPTLRDAILRKVRLFFGVS